MEELLSPRFRLMLGSVDWRDRFSEIPPVALLIETPNHVDGQTRIKAKSEWDDHFSSYDFHDFNYYVEKARQWEQTCEP